MRVSHDGRANGNEERGWGRRFPTRQGTGLMATADLFPEEPGCTSPRLVLVDPMQAEALLGNAQYMSPVPEGEYLED